MRFINASHMVRAATEEDAVKLISDFYRTNCYDTVLRTYVLPGETQFTELDFFCVEIPEDAVEGIEKEFTSGTRGDSATNKGGGPKGIGEVVQLFPKRKKTSSDEDPPKE